MGLALTPQDLQVHDPSITTDRAEALIRSALGQIRFHCPAVLENDFQHDDYARGIVVDAILDRVSRGDITTTTTGPMSIRRDTRPRTKVSEELLPATVIEKLCKLTGHTADQGRVPLGKFPPAPPDLFGRL